MMRSDSTSALMLAALRRHLRQEGWTALRLARELGIGVATAKRWMAGKGLTLERLERMAALCGITFFELAREAGEGAPGLAHELTLAQERALSGDIFLAFLFMTVVGGIPSDEIARDFDVPARTMEAALTRLERLALIDRLRSGRVRSRVDRSLLFRKLPMRALFEQHMKQQFLVMDFSATDAIYASEVIKLSDQGAAQLAEMIERHRRDVQALAEHDRETALLARRWYGMLCAMRPLDTAGLREAASGSSI